MLPTYLSSFVKWLCLSLFLVMLVGCASNSRVYLNNDSNAINQVEQVLIMVEYLELKDDVFKYPNFDENININEQDELHMIAEQMLLAKGLRVMPGVLKTSGLVADREYYVDHYVNKKRQEEAIAPPYIVRSVDLNDDQIIAMEWLLAELTEPMSPVLSDYRSFVKSNYQQQTQKIGLDDNTAILVINSYRPRVSFFSQIDIGFGFSTTGNDNYVGLGQEQSPPQTSAYLIHAGTGQVIWANHTTLITHKSQERFFQQLPQKTSD